MHPYSSDRGSCGKHLSKLPAAHRPHPLGSASGIARTALHRCSHQPTISQMHPYPHLLHCRIKTGFTYIDGIHHQKVHFIFSKYHLARIVSIRRYPFLSSCAIMNPSEVIAVRILCFGDSNTYGYDPRGFFGDRYGAEDRWVDLFAKQTGHEVVNAGANGREIPRNPYALRLLNEHAPVDIFLVMLKCGIHVSGPLLT